MKPVQYLLMSAALLASVGGVWADGPLVPAEKGDGIHSLLARHGISGAKAVEDFIRLNKGELGPGNALLLGRKYRLPETDQIVLEPLFGPEHERVRIVDRLLAGATFYLVSGHGGPDTGAIGREQGHFLHEDEYAYDVTLRLGRRLLEHGAGVHFIIRDKGDGIRDGRYLRGNKSERCYPDEPIPENQRQRLQQRADAVNKLYRSESGEGYRRCLVIHVDSRSHNEGIDTFFYHNADSAEGRRLAETIRDTFEKEYRINQPGRGYGGSVETRRLFMLDETAPATVFVELGNIKHERDKERILVPGNREAVAKWMCEGIIEDFKRGN